VSGHRGIPDEVVKRAQLYDHAHFREDRERGGSWGSVPADQVRRLLWGAYGGMPVVIGDEPRPAVVFDEHDLAAIGLHEDGGEEGT